MATFRIGSNSVNITGRSIKIVDGDIFVDGNNITSMVQVPENRILEVRIVEGVLDNLDSSANVVCGEVRGNVDASGNVTCGNVGGSIDAGGNVVCGNVEGNLDAGGNVTAQNIKGSVDAGGNIRIIG